DPWNDHCGDNSTSAFTSSPCFGAPANTGHDQSLWAQFTAAPAPISAPIITSLLRFNSWALFLARKNFRHASTSPLHSVSAWDILSKSCLFIRPSSISFSLPSLLIRRVL